MENKLWELQKDWLENYRWVDLSHRLSPDTPHWSGFPALSVKQKFGYEDGFYNREYTLVGQYGTHVDAPAHFVKGARWLHELRPEEMVLPLCVMDLRDKVRDNADYIISPRDVLDWEKLHGRIPEGSFVAACTGWSQREDMDNFDSQGHKHYPGWGMEVLKLLAEERHVKAIGHETSDTDAAADSDAFGSLRGEYYILEQDCFQIELMKNLDKVPAAGSLIFCGFPAVEEGGGFTARCIALCPKN
ncbi:MAG: cyclase family protein [Candidatus Limivicinus sp.]|jgi:kynurenine formamidase